VVILLAYLGTLLALGNGINRERKDPTMRTAIAYVRVSTGKQRDEGVSVDMQISKIKAYAAFNDLTLAAIYGDAISAKNIKARPGMQAVLDLARRKRIQHVLVFKLDRAFRNTVEALETAKMLDKSGVALHSLTEKLDTKSAMGEFVFTLMASLAQMERKTIGERTKAAMGHKKANGEYTGGQAPYGYSSVDGKLVANPEEQEALNGMKTLQLMGFSTRRIVVALANDGIRTRKGTHFTQTQVCRILKAA
jgi:site-specific DNA recombinase